MYWEEIAGRIYRIKSTTGSLHTCLQQIQSAYSTPSASPVWHLPGKRSHFRLDAHSLSVTGHRRGGGGNKKGAHRPGGGRVTGFFFRALRGGAVQLGAAPSCGGCLLRGAPAGVPLQTGVPHPKRPLSPIKPPLCVMGWMLLPQLLILRLRMLLRPVSAPRQAAFVR